MTNTTTSVNQWDDRYSRPEFAYGEEPNAYLKEQLSNLSAGTILFPAEGEGRNAVFAATQGWNVSAFDQSSEGKKKALQLADKKGVTIDYVVGEFQQLSYKEGQFDAIALIYAHFPADKKSSYHKTLATYLKTGGIVIIEAFSKQHIEYVRRNPAIGGPKDVAMLFSKDEIVSDFEHFDILEIDECEVNLHEGDFHNGIGSVLRFVGRKK